MSGQGHIGECWLRRVRATKRWEDVSHVHEHRARSRRPPLRRPPALLLRGPNKPEDVVPFLRNVTAGKGIPDARLEEVGEHYYGFGGKSPINEQNLALKAALEDELAARGSTCRSSGATGTGRRTRRTPWKSSRPPVRSVPWCS